ncbi:MAG: hypothetical protein MJ245_02695 [Clostridia bacterium]|nr:hypothetical protein [Clostridia bacterium]
MARDFNDVLNFAKEEGFSKIEKQNMTFRGYDVYEPFYEGSDMTSPKAKLILANDNEIRFTTLNEFLGVIGNDLNMIDSSLNDIKNANDIFYEYEITGDDVSMAEKITVLKDGSINVYKYNSDSKLGNMIHKNYTSENIISELNDVYKKHSDFINEVNDKQVINPSFREISGWEEKTIIDGKEMFALSPTMHDDNEINKYKEKDEVMESLIMENKYMDMKQDIFNVLKNNID